MQIQKRCVPLFFVFLMLASISMTVCAREVPDISEQGSITVTMTYENKSVSGGALTLYRVGSVAEHNGNYSFTPAGDFTDSGFSLKDIQSARLAKKLAGYASDHRITGTVRKIGNDGKVIFSDLEPGLYLLVQTKAASGYHSADPFLVSVPMHEDGTYMYDVDASPKVELEKEPVPATPSSPEKPSTPVLPQTGQLNWPVPILAILGLAMFAAGWMLRFVRKTGSYEK